MSVSDLSNAVQVSDSLIFTNLKAIFFGKYLSKRAFTASRSPVCRKAEIWKSIEIKGFSVIPSRRTRSSKLLPLGPITASLTLASAGEPKSERIDLQQHNSLKPVVFKFHTLSQTGCSSISMNMRLKAWHCGKKPIISGVIYSCIGLPLSRP